MVGTFRWLAAPLRADERAAFHHEAQLRQAVAYPRTRPSLRYQPRSPAQRVLYQVVRDHLETFRLFSQDGQSFSGRRLEP